MVAPRISLEALQTLAHIIYGILAVLISKIYHDIDIVFIATSIFTLYQFIDYMITRDCLGKEFGEYFIGVATGFLIPI